MTPSTEGVLRSPSIRIFLTPAGRWAAIVCEAGQEKARLGGYSSMDEAIEAIQERWPAMNRSVPEFRPTLGEMLGGLPPPVAPKPYLVYCKTTTEIEEPTVVLVDLRKLNDALRGDPDWAASRDERWTSTFNEVRYAKSLEDVREHAPIFMPWLTFDAGRIRVHNGRHRLYALLDEGYTQAKVVVSPQHAFAIQTIAVDHPAR